MADDTTGEFTRAELVMIYIHELGLKLPVDALSRAIGRLEVTFEARRPRDEDEDGD